MKKALLVIDMQNDYLYEKRKAKFSYDTENLVNSVNSLIEKYHGENSDVIYIRHIIQNLPTNRLLFGYSIAGTEGAEIYSGIKIVSEHCYDKLLGDALTNKKLLSMIKEKKYDVLQHQLLLVLPKEVLRLKLFRTVQQRCLMKRKLQMLTAN